MKPNKLYSLEYKCKKINIIIIVNFARFGEAAGYLSKRNDYKFGLNISMENKINPEKSIKMSSSGINLNDSLMYFKEEIIKL